MSTPSNLLSKNSLHGIISLKHKGEKCLERVKFACAKKISINSAKDRLLRIRDLLLNSIATTAENASMKREEGDAQKGLLRTVSSRKDIFPPNLFPRGTFLGLSSIKVNIKSLEKIVLFQEEAATHTEIGK